MNLVAELTTISAPHSMGRQRAGEARGVVDHQRQLVLVGDAGEGFDIGDVELGIAERLGVNGLGLFVDRLFAGRRNRRHRRSEP